MKGFRKISINKEDKEWGRLVRERDGKCLYCGKTEYLQAHHLFSRGRSATRFNLKNGFTLCAGCHTFNPSFSAHRTPDKFKEWAKGYLGKDFPKLERLANTTLSRTKAIEQFNILKNNYAGI